MADGRADDRRDALRWGPVYAAGAVAAYPADMPANSRHIYRGDTEVRYAPLWVIIGRSSRVGKFPLPVPAHRPAGAQVIEEAGLLDRPPAGLAHPRRSPAWTIGGATAVGLPEPSLLRIAHRRGSRHSGLAPTDRETAGLMAARS
ncbi:hypothetical protein IU448_21575 [Nocardia flavorosea]|uniref:hypothetical protein n=1 Tax=Nocardia flavorosea TaxID=53429 RepID=UPI001895A0B9|nr:hypothetical protein [Nocardia flavorosea]MBF6351581.1 hypothetical protein [Nocardia flavorosea]